MHAYVTSLGSRSFIQRQSIIRVDEKCHDRDEQRARASVGGADVEGRVDIRRRNRYREMEKEDAAIMRHSMLLRRDLFQFVVVAP